jgi:hypothetical protein
MPIRINLLAEAQAAEEARRRDPVKRAIWVAGTLILIMLLWGGYEFSKAMVANSELQTQQATWNGIAATFGMVRTNEARLKDFDRKLNSLTQLSTNRFLWGNCLNALQQCFCSPNPLAGEIQMLRISGYQTYSFIDAEKPRKQGEKTIPGRPAQATEKITLIIEGKDYGNPATQNYLRLRANIFNVPFFKTNLVTIEAIQLKTLNPQQVPDAEGKMFYTFVLECKFPEKKREDR